MIDIFIAYSKLDVAYKDELKKHLYPYIRGRQVPINLWDNFNIEPGEDWDNTIQKNLESADIILLLVSVDALESEYFYDREAKIALARHNKKEAIAIPIILRRCGWIKTPIKDLEVLPEKGLPISEWPNRDHAWDDTVSKLGAVIDKVELKKKNEALEAELRLKFNASIQSGKNSLKKKNWKEAKTAFSNALGIHRRGFEPAKTDIQNWIKECTDAIQKQEDKIREDKAAKAEIARIKEERQARELKDEEARNEKKALEDLLIKPPQPSPLPTPPKKEEVPKAQPHNAPALAPQTTAQNKAENNDSDINIVIRFFTFLAFIIFLLHYSLRIKYFEYVTPKGHWLTVIILSLISLALYGLVAWIAGKMSKSKKGWLESLGGILIIALTFLLLYGFYKPLYTYYAFDAGLLINPESSITSQESGLNTNNTLAATIQPDSSNKSITPQKQDTIADTPEQTLQKLGIEMVALLSKRYYLTVDSDNSLANCVEVIKKMKNGRQSGQTIGYVGYCQTDHKYYVLVDSKDYYSSSLAMSAAQKIKNYKVAVRKLCK